MSGHAVGNVTLTVDGRTWVPIEDVQRAVEHMQDETQRLLTNARVEIARRPKSAEQMLDGLERWARSLQLTRERS